MKELAPLDYWTYFACNQRLRRPADYRGNWPQTARMVTPTKKVELAKAWSTQCQPPGDRTDDGAVQLFTDQTPIWVLAQLEILAI